MKLISFKKKSLIVILFTVYITTSAQTKNSNETFLVTIFFAGNCNNVITQDELIDSICKKHNIPHFYYFINLQQNEVEEYSQSIFGIKFNKNQLINEIKINQLRLDTIKKTNRLLFVKNDKILKNIDISSFDEIQLIEFKSNSTSLNNEFYKYSKQLIKTDSFVLKYKYKIKADSNIRFNYRCILKKQDSSIFILEPLFKKHLYKISSNTGQIIEKISIEKCLVNYDSILFCVYKNQITNHPSIKDSLLKYSDLLKHKIKTNFYNLAIEEDQLYLSSDIGIIVLNAYNKPHVLNYRVIYKLDKNLKIENYFVDPFISYRNFFVDFTYLDLFNKNSIQMRLMNFSNSNEKILRSIYCKLIESEHKILKFDRDSVVIPNKFEMEFNSNQTTHQMNISDINNPAWLLDPYPYIYFPRDSVFFNFLKNEIDTNKNITFKSNILTQRISTLFSNDSIVKLVYLFNDFSYLIEIDLINKEQISIIPIGPLQKLYLEPIFEENGNLCIFPTNIAKNGNYIYFK